MVLGSVSSIATKFLAFEVVFSHQTCNTVLTAEDAFLPEFGMHARVAVAFMTGLVDAFNVCH